MNPDQFGILDYKIAYADTVWNPPRIFTRVAARQTSYHAHAGPPWVCRGGCGTRENGQYLVETILEIGDHPTTRLVESLDDPLDCCYRRLTDVVLVGYDPVD